MHSMGTERKPKVARWETAAWDRSHLENWTRMEKQGRWSEVLDAVQFPMNLHSQMSDINLKQ